MTGLRTLAAAGVLLALSATGAVAADEPEQTPDEIYGKDEMDAAREALREGAGGQINYLVMAERLEYRTNEGDPVGLWDAEGWVGGDRDKFWVKTEGEYLIDAGHYEEAEVQALYSRAISPFIDLQAGLRHDFEPDPSRNFAVVGFQGLAPYWIEFDAAAFVSDDGDLEARVEAEYEIPITARLIAQPRTELNFAAQDVEEVGVGAGLSTVDLGLRVRYEIIREVAPYVGVSWTRAVGETADFARDEGEDVGSVSFVTGVRMWF